MNLVWHLIQLFKDGEKIHKNIYKNCFDKGLNLEFSFQSRSRSRVTLIPIGPQTKTTILFVIQK